MTEVADPTSKLSSIYISYSRRDASFMRTLYQGLLDHGMGAENIWIDWEDVTFAESWEEEVKQAMASVEVFVFVITPAALESKTCLEEIRLAEEAKLKFVPIFHTDMLKGQHIPSVISHANWVYMRENVDDFSVVLPALIATINTDLEYIEKHTRYQVRAHEWVANDQKPDFLVAGDELSEGERWLTHGLEHGEPKPTSDQAEYLVTSRQHDTKVKRQQRRRLGIILFVAILFACGAIFFWQQAKADELIAHQQETEAYAAGTLAQEKSTEANIARETAEADRAVALTQENIAEAAATEESIALAEAQTQEAVAHTQEAIANLESTAAAEAVSTALSAVETAEAEVLARATQQAIAIAESNERATQQALAEGEANQRATQLAIKELEADRILTQQAIAEAEEATAQAAATQSAQNAAEARARALAAAALNIMNSDPQLSRLLALLSYQETKLFLTEPLVETKAVLLELSKHPLRYIWTTPPAAKFMEAREASGGVTQLLVYPGTAGTLSIDVYNYDTRTLISAISLGFVPDKIKLSTQGNILSIFSGNATTARVQLFDMTNPAYPSQTINDTYPSVITPYIIYPSTAVKSDAAILDKLTDVDINQNEDLLVAVSNNFTATLWDLTGFPGSAPTKILEADVWDQTDLDYTFGAIPGAPWTGWHHSAQARSVAFRTTNDDYFALGSFGLYNESSLSLSYPGKEHEWLWDGDRSSFHTGATLSVRRNSNILYPIGLSELAYAADGTMILGTANTLFTHWNRQSTVAGVVESGHSSTINSLDASTDKSMFITTGEGGAVIIWEYLGPSKFIAAKYGDYPIALRDGVLHRDKEQFAVVDANGDIAFLTTEFNTAFTWTDQLTLLNTQMIRSKTLTSGECALYGASNCTYTAALNSQPVAQANDSLPFVFSAFFSVIAVGVFVQSAAERKRQ